MHIYTCEYFVILLLSVPLTTGGVIKDAATLPICKKLIDQWVLVDEEQIAEAVCYCLKEHKKVRLLLGDVS